MQEKNSFMDSNFLTAEESAAGTDFLRDGYKIFPVSDFQSLNALQIEIVNSAAELAFYMKAHRCSRQDILFWNGLPSHHTVTKGDIIAIRRY